MDSKDYCGVSQTAQSGHRGTAYSNGNAPMNTDGILTTMWGCPVAHNKNSLTAGPHGPVMLQDTYLMEKIKQFSTEKTPPRVVHALGCGAAGTFTVTSTEITKYTKAKLFSEIGKKTPVAVRMSGTFTEQGEADLVRDLRGFACKFKTEEGIWDLMTINTPVFNCRDMKIGPDAVHAFKRDPRSGLWNPAQSWDFVAHHPEAIHQVLMIYGDRVGTPLSFRMMHGFSANTYSFLNSENKRFWVRFHLCSQQGTKGFNVNQAKLMCGEDPNFLQRDLKEAIEKGDFPKWKLCVQLMTEEEGYKNPFTFDCTKVWSKKDYPLIEIGILELNKNPVDHFTEVESIAFSPARIVPGIGFSPDKLLQGRLLIYDDTQQHRLGPNFKQMPINAPLNEVNSNYYISGPMNMQTRAKFPHYDGSVFGFQKLDTSNVEPPMKVDGPVGFYDMPYEGTDADWYEQPREFLRVCPETEKKNLCFNIAASLMKIPIPEIPNMMMAHFTKIDPTFAATIKNFMQEKINRSIPLTDGEKVLQAADISLGIKNVV